jgi:GxGYxYP putative glycoside hydrolase C-terminal domain
MAWLEPLSPIVGWNGGDEFESTRLSTIHGHFQTATDWCMNLPVLMAGSERAEPARLKGFDPREIDWDDRRSAVSFIASDGDNVQWLEGDFFANTSYWRSPDRGRIPFGWSCCFAHLAQLCPPAVDHAVATRGTNDWFVEWGGGYYYPDLFARERPDRWGLLARHARRTWGRMRANNTRVIGFNVWQPDSPDARRAYEVFAGETDGLLAILVFQYSPYEGGGGKTYWVKDRKGGDVPVITARYSIWEHSNDRPRSGTPAKVAREIRETVARTPPAELPRYDWAIAHVWSSFRRAPGADEEAEDLPRERRADRDRSRGYTPVTWCAERLPEGIRVVCPEELIWRIRFKHDAQRTKAMIDEFRP